VEQTVTALVRRGTFATLGLVAVEAVGAFRCGGCASPDVVALTEPADPAHPHRAPRCERCGAFMLPINGPERAPS
jgi:hypothetical protein